MATMIKLTQPDNKKQWWIDGNDIRMMHRYTEYDDEPEEEKPDNPPEYTEICFHSSGTKIVVEEHPEEIIRRINWAEAKHQFLVNDILTNMRAEAMKKTLKSVKSTRFPIPGSKEIEECTINASTQYDDPTE